MEEFTSIVQAREPIALDVIGCMDGVALHSQCTSETGEQKAMYNLSWKCRQHVFTCRDDNVSWN